MGENIRLKGEYEFSINYSNMFMNQWVTLTYSNTITEIGIEFFITKILTSNEEDKIQEIIFGTELIGEPEKAQITNFENPYRKPINDITHDQNTITLFLSNIRGENVRNTTAIGVIGLLDNKQILISNNTHNRINVPTTCIMNLKYTYTLTG